MLPIPESMSSYIVRRPLFFFESTLVVGDGNFFKRLLGVSGGGYLHLIENVGKRETEIGEKLYWNRSVFYIFHRLYCSPV